MKITRENLETGMNLLIEMNDRRKVQDMETDEAQAATRERNDALEILEDKMDDYSDILQIALAETAPETLERLGL